VSYPLVTPRSTLLPLLVTPEDSWVEYVPDLTFKRVCLPASHHLTDIWSSENLLKVWNQRWSREYGNPWGSEVYFHLGEVLINSGSSVWLRELSDWNYRYTYLPMGKLRGSECNWSIDKDNQKYSLEFILDNELEEVNPLVVTDDDQSTFWSVGGSGTSGTLSISISDDSTEYLRGSNSLKITVDNTGTYDVVYIYHNFSSTQDWSGYEFITLWFYGSGTGDDIGVKIQDSGGNVSRWWITDDFIGWKRFILPLKHPDTTPTGTEADLSRVIQIAIDDIQTTGTWYLDRVVLDVGQWITIEHYIPDCIRGVNLYSNSDRLALSFDGEDYVKVADNPSLNPTTAITIEVMFYPSSTPSAPTDLVGKRNSANDGSFILTFDSTNKIFLWIRHLDSWIGLRSKTALLGRWCHTIGVYDGLQLKLYLDGSLDATRSYEGAIDDASGIPVTLGYSPRTGRYLTGFIAFARIYDRALSESEVEHNYNCISTGDTPVTDGLVLWLDTDSVQGDTWMDKSGYGNNGTIYGARWNVKMLNGVSFHDIY